MSPRATTFTREAVLQAAVDVVRRLGWNGLTARGVAERLGSSVAPVYSAFGSMDSLMRETLREIRSLLWEFTAPSYSDMPFLNIGTGIVCFARDEPLLYQALFQTRHGFQDVVEGINQSILSRMSHDARLALLSKGARERLYDNIGFYTMGLAAAVAAGRKGDLSAENIIGLLKNMGNIVMFAEAAGIADSESAENEREWARIMKKKTTTGLPNGAQGRKSTGTHTRHSQRMASDNSRGNKVKSQQLSGAERKAGNPDSVSSEKRGAAKLGKVDRKR
jgi:AcrR family transcriptional regulator